MLSFRISVYIHKPIKTEDRLCTASTETLMFTDGVAVSKVIPFNCKVCVNPNERSPSVTETKHQTGIERSSFPHCNSFRGNY